MQVKIRSILKASGAGIVAGFIFLVLFPYLLIQLNFYFDLLAWHNTFLTFTGSLFIIGGASLFFYCSGLFYRWGRGTPAPIEPPKRLVSKGIYEYTRNPMYLGYFSIIWGEFLFFGGLLLLGYFLFVVALINRYLILVEEPKLVKRFGFRYVDYMQRVPRWVKIKR